VNIASHRLSHGACPCPLCGGLGQQRQHGIAFVQIFQNGQGLRNDQAIIVQCRQQLHWIDLHIIRLMLLTAIFKQMNRLDLVIQTLEVQTNPYPVSGGTAKVAIQNHLVSCPPCKIRFFICSGFQSCATALEAAGRQCFLPHHPGPALCLRPVPASAESPDSLELPVPTHRPSHPRAFYRPARPDQSFPVYPADKLPRPCVRPLRANDWSSSCWYCPPPGPDHTVEP